MSAVLLASCCSPRSVGPILLSSLGNVQAFRALSCSDSSNRLIFGAQRMLSKSAPGPAVRCGRESQLRGAWEAPVRMFSASLASLSYNHSAP